MQYVPRLNEQANIPSCNIISGVLCATNAAGPPPPGAPPGPGTKKPRPPPDYSTTLETELREDLFSGYSADQRPQKKVHVKIVLNLLSINYLVRTLNSTL